MSSQAVIVKGGSTVGAAVYSSCYLPTPWTSHLPHKIRRLDTAKVASSSHLKTHLELETARSSLSEESRGSVRVLAGRSIMID